MKRVLIIAEAGVNHNGSFEIAKKLVDVAIDAGADIVKFQTFKAENLVDRKACKADYQQKTTSASETQFDMLKKLELTHSEHIALKDYCGTRISFLSTPFDLESIDMLKELGITIGKIPSGEITNLPYLKKMASSFSDIILSTGMCEMEEIDEALNVIMDEGIKKDNITVLHCNTEYPTPFEDVNLSAMNEIGRELGVRVGYSDHTPGIEVPVAAVALGAIIIEKHFTLDKAMDGPDHKASLAPSELKAMVSAIRNIEKAMGSGIKQPSPSEKKNKISARKSIVAAKYLSAGHILTHDDLTVKRPGSGISPMKIDAVVGKKLLKNIEQDELLSFEYLVE